jgi:hypothetical protein
VLSYDHSIEIPTSIISSVLMVELAEHILPPKILTSAQILIAAVLPPIHCTSCDLSLSWTLHCGWLSAHGSTTSPPITCHVIRRWPGARSVDSHFDLVATLRGSTKVCGMSKFKETTGPMVSLDTSWLCFDRTSCNNATKNKKGTGVLIWMHQHGMMEQLTFSFFFVHCSKIFNFDSLDLSSSR